MTRVLYLLYGAREQEMSSYEEWLGAIVGRTGCRVLQRALLDTAAGQTTASQQRGNNCLVILLIGELIFPFSIASDI